MSDYLGPYKGYIGSYEILLEEGYLYGKLLGLSGLVNYRGGTVEELKREFEESVDFYLDACAEQGEEPEKPFTSNILLRLPPNQHRDLFIWSQKIGVSKNQFIADAINAYIESAKNNSGTQTTPCEAMSTGEGDNNKPDMSFAEHFGAMPLDVVPWPQ